MSQKKKPAKKKIAKTKNAAKKPAAKSRTKKVGMSEPVSSKAGKQPRQNADERRLMERTLHMNETVYQQIMDSMTDSLTILNAYGTILFANSQAAHNLSGLAPSTIIGRNISRFVPQAQAENLVEKYRRVIATNKPLVQEVMVTLKGVDRWFINTLQPISSGTSNIPLLLSTSRDITGRKLREANLIESEEKFRSIYNNIGIGVALIGQGMEVLSLNPQMQQWFPHINLEQHSLCYRSFNTPPRDTPCNYCPTLHTLKDGKVHTAVTDTPTPDGIRHYQIISSPLMAADGSISAAIEMVEDITDRKRATDALSESQTLLMTQLQNSPDIVMVLDRQYRYISLNKVVFSNNTVENLIGENAITVLPEHVRAMVQNEINTCFSTNTVRTFEHEAGIGQWALARVVPLPSLGQTDRVMIISTDITERKMAEHALKESEARFRELFENAADAIFLADMDTGVIVDANRAASVLMAMPHEKIIGLHQSHLHPPKKITYSKAAFHQHKVAAAQSMPAHPVEHAIVRPDGTEVPIEILASEVTFKGQRCLMGTFRNLTERKKAEEKLLTSESRLKESQRTAKIGNWSWDVVNNTLDWSEEAFRRFDTDPATFTPTVQYYVDRIHPDDRASIQKAIQDSLENDSPYHIQPRITNENGRKWVLEGFGFVERDANGKPLRFAGTVQDITDRVRSEDTLRRSERALSEAQRIAHIGSLEFDVPLRTARFSSELMRILDLDPSAPTPSFEEFQRFVHPDDRSAFLSSCERVFQQGVPFYIDYRLQLPSGILKHVQCIGKPYATPDSQSITFHATIQDITDRKRAEEKIRQNEEFIRNILDTVDEGFIVIDRDYRILTANKAYCKQVEKPCEEVISKHCHEVSHQLYKPCFEEGEDCAAWHVFETGIPHSTTHQHRDARGGIVYVETKGYPIKDSSGVVTSVIETINNITERHLLEEERLKTQKLESIGTLAGGIAHDFNNLLQGVFGYISMAKLTFDQRDKSLEMLEQAEKALHQSVNLTTQLLTFSKGGKPVKKRMTLKPVIENAVKFALSGSRSEYRITSDPDLWQVEADGGQLGQVIQNIVLNADQAMPLGGSVAIIARNLPASDELRPPNLAQRDYVLISIQDNGVGISEQYLGKIFDPYFTTKEKGSGLGLATSYSIIRNHDGMVEVRSEIGKGTTFRIYLPASAAVAAKMISAAVPLGTRIGRILVMDDEVMIRKVAGELLKALGHTPSFADKGETALDAYQKARESGQPFDIVILDLTIRGGMGGEDALKKLLELDPGVKAVVSSGYSDDASFTNYQEQGFKAFLKKPYNIVELQNTLNALLV